MDCQKENLQEEKDHLELKDLKRKNRRRNGFLALLALQVGSVLFSYYLGRSHK